jgi:DNA topoisomerase-3
MLYAKKIAQGKGIVIPEEAKANSAAMSAWIDSNRSAKRRKRGRKTAYKATGSVAPRSTATTKSLGNAKLPLLPLHRLPRSQIQLLVRRCGFVALKLGARYRSGGWYAASGIDLSALERADGCDARRYGRVASLRMIHSSLGLETTTCL